MKVLASGLDTLCFSYNVGFQNVDLLNRSLEHSFTALLESGHDYKTIKISDKEVLKFGNKKFIGGTYWFYNDDLDIFINPNRSGCPIKFRFRALGLHRNNVNALLNRVHVILDKQFSAYQKLDSEPLIYRADLHIDVLSALPLVSPKNVLTRAKTQCQYFDKGNLNAFTVGKRGKSTIFFRCYDKNLEVEKTGKEWIYDYYESLGYTGGSVTRFEWELGSKVLKDKDMRTWAKFSGLYSALFSHLANNYIRLVENKEFDCEYLPIWRCVCDYIKNHYHDGWSPLSGLNLNRDYQAGYDGAVKRLADDLSLLSAYSRILDFNPSFDSLVADIITSADFGSAVDRKFKKYAPAALVEKVFCRG